MKAGKIRVGSRDSKLAVTQSELVMKTIQRAHPELELELITMKTTGDLILDRSLDKIGGKGLFVKELDQALRDGRIDFAVHSLKDMPMETPEDLPLLAFSKREDPRDALVLPKSAEEDSRTEDAPASENLKSTNGALTWGPQEKPIGSSSARRNLQLQKLYPEITVSGVRGNVMTRLAKLDRGDYSALILASAGLRRLNLESRITRVFEPWEMIPAAGQGIMVVQGRAGEDYGYLSCVNDRNAELAALAERAFVRTLDGGCSSPIAAYASVEGENIRLTGLYYMEAKNRYITGEITGHSIDGEQLGSELAIRLKSEV